MLVAKKHAKWCFFTWKIFTNRNLDKIRSFVAKKCFCFSHGSAISMELLDWKTFAENWRDAC